MDNFISVRLFALCLILSIFLFFYKYLWQRRRLLYHGWKIPGPLAFPFVGNALLVNNFSDVGSFYKQYLFICKVYPPIFRLWLGPELFVMVSDPKALKAIFTKNLDKGVMFKELTKEFLKESLLSAPVEQWRKCRRICVQSFNTVQLHANIEIFQKQAELLCRKFSENFVEEKLVDVYPTVARSIFDTICETLGGVNPELLKNQDEFVSRMTKIHHLTSKHLYTIFYFLFWRFSSARRDMMKMASANEDVIRQMVDLVGNDNSDSHSDKKQKKSLLSHLLSTQEENSLEINYIIQEITVFIMAGNETSSHTVCSVLIMMALHPEIQDKVIAELNSVFDGTETEISIKTLNEMEYLERVIKETMRMLSPIPLIVRAISEDVILDSCVIPSGSKVMIPLSHIHRDPRVWEKPSKFNPDRFLPENMIKMDQFSYIPFSYGPRNCIGFRYAMLSMKTMLATILKNFKVVLSEYKSIDEIELICALAAIASKGYKIKMERR